jgi:ABC-type microcin C transport system duplicated ATPase subunit YejF
MPLSANLEVYFFLFIIMLRETIQMLFQGPYASRSSRVRIIDIITEHLVTHEAGAPIEKCEQAGELLFSIVLSEDNVDTHPHQLYERRMGVGKSSIIGKR